MRLTAGLGLALLLLLTGCAAPPEPSPAVSADEAKTLWRQHRDTIAGISAFRLSGKIAVKTGRKGGNATLLWQLRGEDEQIELWGPFGSGRIRINARPGHAVLVDTKGRRSEGVSAAQALERRLGWLVPFAQLRHWVRGIPAADVDGENGRASELVVDRAGRLKRFRQGDWRVEYQNYAAVGEWDLPRRLSISALPGRLEIYADDGAYIGDQLSVTMVLKNWRDIGVDD